MKYEYVRRVLSGGRITIDEVLRKRLGINVGDYVITRIRKGHLEIVKAEIVVKQ